MTEYSFLLKLYPLNSINTKISIQKLIITCYKLITVLRQEYRAIMQNKRMLIILCQHIGYYP